MTRSSGAPQYGLLPATTAFERRWDAHERRVAAAVAQTDDDATTAMDEEPSTSAPDLVAATSVGQMADELNDAGSAQPGDMDDVDDSVDGSSEEEEEDAAAPAAAAVAQHAASHPAVSTQQAATHPPGQPSAVTPAQAPRTQWKRAGSRPTATKTSIHAYGTHAARTALKNKIKPLAMRIGKVSGQTKSKVALVLRDTLPR